MGDAVKRYKIIYQMVSRLATEFSLLPATAGSPITNRKGGGYGLAIKNICNDGFNESIEGKLWTLQDLSGTVPGSLGAALLEIGDNTSYPTTEWGILQATNIQKLCSIFEFFQSGIGHVQVTQSNFTFNGLAKLLFYVSAPELSASVMFPKGADEVSQIINLISFSIAYMQAKIDTLCDIKVELKSNPDELTTCQATLNLHANGHWDADTLITNTYQGYNTVISVDGLSSGVIVASSSNVFPGAEINFSQNIAGTGLSASIMYFVGINYDGSNFIPLSLNSDGIELITTTNTEAIGDIVIVASIGESSFTTSSSGLYNIGDTFSIESDGECININKGGTNLITTIDPAKYGRSLTYTATIKPNTTLQNDVYLSHVQMSGYF